MIYLDNAATSGDELFMRVGWRNELNPNANYSIEDSMETLLLCEEQIKDALGINNGCVCFCSNASDAARIIHSKIKFSTTTMAHASAYDLWRDCNIIPWATLYTPVNNVTGAFEEIEKDGRRVILDLTSTIGRVDFEKGYFDNVYCAYYSGHKIHAPFGTGVIWCSDLMMKHLGLTKSPTNNHGLFHGTVSTSGAVAIAEATEYVANRSRYPYSREWKLFEKYLRDNDIKFAYAPTGVDSIRCVRICGVNAMSLQTYLAEKDIFVGLGGSACDKGEDFRVLNAFGVREHEQEYIRISMDANNNNMCEGWFKALPEAIANFKNEF